MLASLNATAVGNVLPAEAYESREAEAEEPSAPPASSDLHWSSLPLLGEQARQRGYTLPLPFGVSSLYNYVSRDIQVTDVRVGINGAPVRYVNAGFAPAYWGGFGFGPGLFTGFLLGQAFAPHAFFAPGGDFGGGDFGGGDFGGGDFGG